MKHSLGFYLAEILLILAITAAVTSFMPSKRHLEPIKEPLGGLYIDRGSMPHLDMTYISKRRLNALECMSNLDCTILAITGYFEARSESNSGVEAVMHTVMNRVEHKRWGSSVLDVVFEPHQFSFVLDGSLDKGMKSQLQWNRMLRIASKVLHERSDPLYSCKEDYCKVTHYHNTKVTPKWRDSFNFVSKIGNHLFYACTRYC